MVVVFVDGKQQKCGGSGGGKVIEMWWGVVFVEEKQ